MGTVTISLAFGRRQVAWSAEIETVPILNCDACRYTPEGTSPTKQDFGARSGGAASDCRPYDRLIYCGIRRSAIGLWQRDLSGCFKHPPVFPRGVGHLSFPRP